MRISIVNVNYMKTKKILFIILLSLIIICNSCTEKKDDYRISSKWTGLYDCEKYSGFYNRSYNVLIDVLMTDEDSALYIREHIIYDVDAINEDEVKCKVKINTDGFFVGKDRYDYYIDGCIRNDSLFANFYLGDTPNVYETNIIRYNGTRLKE